LFLKNLQFRSCIHSRQFRVRFRCIGLLLFYLLGLSYSKSRDFIHKGPKSIKIDQW